jgi:hypothetical protein
MIFHDESHKFKCTMSLEDGTQCTGKYRTRMLLENHVKLVHNNIKPFPCKQCDKEFRGRRALVEHILADHMNIRLKCVVTGCQLKFKNKRALRYHVKSYHKSFGKDEMKKHLKMVTQLPLPKIKI